MFHGNSSRKKTAETIRQNEELASSKMARAPIYNTQDNGIDKLCRH